MIECPEPILRLMHNAGMAMCTAADTWASAAITRQENEWHDSMPHRRYKPRLSIDGNQWCALYGDNLQDGVAGFGDSPELAMADFDRAWSKPLPNSPSGQEGKP